MSEQDISKEQLQHAPFIYGISVSNLANDTNPRRPLPSHTGEILNLLASHNMGIEFQIESPDCMGFTVPESQSPAFIGVHLPIRDVDFIDPGKRSQSFRYGLNNIQFAADNNADYVVAHMLTKQEWDRIGMREQFIAESKIEMEELVRQSKSTGFTGKYLFENLEFPLYPSTAREILDMQAWTNYLSQKHDIETGICLDLGHLWHTGIMIEINKAKGEVMQPYFEDPYAAGATDFLSYLFPLAQQIAPDLELIHMTGTHIHQTHLQPQVSSAMRESDRITLNLQQSMQHISQIVTASNKQIYVVNEAHNSDYEEMIAHSKAVRNFFTYE